MPTSEQGWLEAAVDEPVAVFLRAGEKVLGVFRGSDEHTIVVETGTDEPTNLIYEREVRLIRW